jgi:alkanesulfonate monooxygenase SsuD/methylene tetrahydromethanopterin reductase-like flavin-dependent oxidoreductase (luciferase family)
MNVRFGVSVLSGTAFPHRRDLDQLAELIRIIDGSGVELIGTNDTSFIGGDAYVRATLIARTATNAQVGIHPTNPLTREPQIMAAFMASIDAMTEGRAFLDIGSGDSAVYNIGLQPASRARIADYVTCVRDLIATGEGSYDGRPQRVRWHREAVCDRIPITLCAEGPKTLNLGGRLFDGVIAGTGLLPEVISDTIERVAAGAVEAGRDPADAEVWFTTRSSLDADHDKAVERIHASVSSILNHSMRFSLDGKNVPGQFRAKIAEYVEGYELYDHVLQAGRNPKRMAELGLTEYGLNRFALAGDVKAWIERIGELAELGASRLWLSTESGDLNRQIHYMRVFTEQIMPHFR